MTRSKALLFPLMKIFQLIKQGAQAAYERRTNIATAGLWLVVANIAMEIKKEKKDLEQMMDTFEAKEAKIQREVMALTKKEDPVVNSNSIGIY